MKTFSIFDFRFSIAGNPPAPGSALTRGEAVTRNVACPAKAKFEIRDSKI